MKSRVDTANEIFLEFISRGDYVSAESFLITESLRAKKEDRWEDYYEFTYLLAVCYQQQGKFLYSKRCLREIFVSRKSGVLLMKSKIILAKISSQMNESRDSATGMEEALFLLNKLNREGIVNEDKVLHLQLPVMWRLGMQKIMSGEEKQGIKIMSKHYEDSASSDYQRANAEMCMAILCASDKAKIKIDRAEESLVSASEKLIVAPDDGTNHFAFRDKSLLGIICLEALLDDKAGRKFQAYKKIQIVRHYMLKWHILATSEGFAEQINPSLPQYKQFSELLSVPESDFEVWVNSHSNADLLLEARIEAAEIVKDIDAKGQAGYSAAVHSSPKSFTGRKIFVFSSRLPDTKRKREMERLSMLRAQIKFEDAKYLHDLVIEGQLLCKQEDLLQNAYTLEYIGRANRWIDACQKFLQSLESDLCCLSRFQALIGDVEFTNSVSGLVAEIEVVEEKYSRIMLIEQDKTVIEPTVFIVHGHDTVALQKTELLLRRIGCNPLIFDRVPKDGSQTIIEVLENTLRRAQAVIVLLTPDDEGRKKGDPCLLPRARQNVLIEGGYAVIEKRNRAIIVALGEVEIPSDFDGIVRVQKLTWNEEVETQLAHKLHDMKLPINLRGL